MKKLRTVLGCALIVTFSGCAPLYVPNYVNAPLLSNKGELQAGLATGINGTDIYTAYALTEKVGITADFSYANRNPESSVDYHRHYTGEVGAGYFGKIGTSGRFECFGSLGLGHSDSGDAYDFASGSRRATSNFFKLSVQPAIGASTSIFDGGLAIRNSYVHLNDVRYYTSNGTEMLQSQANIFTEPVIFARVGYKYVKLTTQFGLSFPLREEYYFSHNPFIFNIGLHVDIWRVWKGED